MGATWGVSSLERSRASLGRSPGAPRCSGTPHALASACSASREATESSRMRSRAPLCKARLHERVLRPSCTATHTYTRFLI